MSKFYQNLKTVSGWERIVGLWSTQISASVASAKRPNTHKLLLKCLEFLGSKCKELQGSKEYNSKFTNSVL